MGAGCHQDPRKRWDRGLTCPCCIYLEPLSVYGGGIREAGTLRCRSLSLRLAVPASTVGGSRESQDREREVPSRCPERVGRRRQAYPGDETMTIKRKHSVNSCPCCRRKPIHAHAIAWPLLDLDGEYGWDRELERS